MKVYYYSPQECGLEEFTPGLMRLAGFEKTTNPGEADVFCVQGGLHTVKVEGLRNLPYLKGNERRHCGLNISDWFKTSIGIPGMWFRCDTTRWVKEQDPTTISWPWPVEDLGEWIDKPFEHDVCFRGWESTRQTGVICDSVLAREDLNSHIKRNDFFYGYEKAGKPKEELKRTFLEKLAGSRLSLVSRSIPAGVIRYRMLEAVSSGRVPVHFCDNCVLPLSDRIDWDRCILTIPEADAPHAGELLADWLSDHTDDDIREMGRYGREMWSRWLDCRKWDDLFGEICEEKIATISK